MAASTGEGSPPVRPDARAPAPAPARAAPQAPLPAPARAAPQATAETAAPQATAEAQTSPAAAFTSPAEIHAADAAGFSSPAEATAPARVRGKAPRHEIRALLRAHLAAASGYRHLTRRCAVCARLLRLAMEPLTASGRPEEPAEAPVASEPFRAAPVAASAPVCVPSPTPPAPARAPAPASAPAPAPAPALTPSWQEQTAEHVSPAEAQEQTVRPVTKPATGPGRDAPRELAERPVPTRTTARLTFGAVPVPPDRARAGREGRHGPAWVEDESPPAA